jgi:hypothetical protein
MFFILVIRLNYVDVPIQGKITECKGLLQATNCKVSFPCFVYTHCGWENNPQTTCSEPQHASSSVSQEVATIVLVALLDQHAESRSYLSSSFVETCTHIS